MMITKEEIQQKYPKSYTQLISFSKKYLREFQKVRLREIEKEEIEIVVPEITNEMAELAVAGMIGINIRMLYDFFSDNNLEISVVYDGMDVGTGRKQFTYRVGDAQQTAATLYMGRINAETEAFRDAFSVLENKLS